MFQSIKLNFCEVIAFKKILPEQSPLKLHLDVKMKKWVGDGFIGDPKKVKYHKHTCIQNKQVKRSQES